MSHYPYNRPRVPREPEAVHPHAGQFSYELMAPSSRARARLDPPDISLSQSQLAMLEKYKARNHQESHRTIFANTTTSNSHVPRDPSVIDERISRTPMRTPNPVARSDISGTKSNLQQQKHLFHRIMQEAGGTLKDSNDTREDAPAVGHRTLKLSLAQQFLRKKPSADLASPANASSKLSSPTDSSSSNPSLRETALDKGSSKVSNEATSGRHKEGMNASFSIRERLRRARTPTKERPKPESSPSKRRSNNSPVVTQAEPMTSKPTQTDANHVQLDRELRLKDHLKAVRSLDDDEARGRAQQIVSKHFAQKHVKGPHQSKTPFERSKENANKGHPVDETSVDEPEGFQDFMKLLQAEVADQHTQMWSSFQATFDKSITPLPPPLHGSTSKPSRSKFDTKSSKILKKLHLQSLKLGNAECAGKSQLVNDKAFSKEVRQLPSLAPSSSEDDPKSLASTTSDPVMQVRSTDDTIASSTTGSTIHEVRTTSNSSDPILIARSTSSEEPRLNRSQPTTSLLDRRESLSTEDDTTLDREVRPSLASPASSFSWTNIQLRPSRNLPSSSSSGSPSPSELPPSSPSATESQIGAIQPEWATLKLRKVLSDTSTNHVQAKRLSRSSPNDSTLESTSGDAVSVVGSIESPTDDACSKESSQGVKLSAGIIGASTLRNSISSTESTSTCPGTKGTTGSFAERTTTTSTDSKDGVQQNTCPFVEGLGERQLIDDKAMMTRLAKSPDMNLRGEETPWVLLGKHVVMGVKKSGEKGDPRAQVLWKMHREEIESLAFNMATLEVTLICSKKAEDCATRVLTLATSEDCLKFANAFYGRDKENNYPQIGGRGTDAEVAQPDANVTQEINFTHPPPAEPTDKSLASEADSFRLDDLTEEEQRLLNTYRELRRTKGAQAALKEMLASDEASKFDKVAKLFASRANAIQSKGNLALKPFPIETKAKPSIGTIPNHSLPQYVEASGDASSPVSLLSHSVLSDCEQLQVERYLKMLRQKVDPNEVRQKMQTDNVTQKVMSVVLKSDTDDANSHVEPELTSEEEQVATSYRTMVKLKFPVEVIRHRMKKEDVSERIMKAVIGSMGQPTVSESSYEAALSDAEEAVAATYRKMLQIGIEHDAVRHRMAKDEVDDKIVQAVVGAEGHVQTAKLSSSKPSPCGKTASQSVSMLSIEEESLASNYRKMLKIQVPKDMVLSRMRQDGVNDKIITAVIGALPAHMNRANIERKEASGNGSKLVSLHWTPLSGKELDNSVWKVNNMLEDLDGQPERSDVSKLVALFQKKTSQGKRQERSTKVDSSTTGKARLLDLTRANNVAISLKAFKEFSYRDLAEIISFLDPLKKVSSEKVPFLRDLLPTAAELDIIRAFDGPDDRLLPAEQWFRSIQGIRRIEAKVKVMITMETYHSEADSLQSNFRLISQVCHQIMESDKLVFLLGKVLRIGNIMNQGTRTGGAAGFKFDSLLRLTQTKSADNKITVLDFLVTSLIDQGQRDTLDLLSDFPDCQTASRIVMNDLLSAVKDLKDGVQKSEEELNYLISDLSGRKPNRLGTSVSDAGSDITSSSMTSKAALLSAILSRDKALDRPKKQEGFAQRDQFLAAIKEKSACTIDGGSSSSPIDLVSVESSGSVKAHDQPPTPFDNSLQGGIARLESFLADAKTALKELDMSRTHALEACNGLARYCGESSGTSATTSLVSILATFASNLQDALKKYDEKQEADSRRQRKRGDDSSTLCSDSVGDSTSGNATDNKPTGASLVLLVNDMLKVANDRTKEDFKKGRTYPNPSSTLKAIYEREQAVGTVGAPSSSPTRKSTRKLDIVSAIREQERTVDQNEMLQARSRFGDVKQSDDDGSKQAESNSSGAAQGSAEAETPFSVQQARAMFEEKLRFPIAPLPPGEMMKASKPSRSTAKDISQFSEVRSESIEKTRAPKEAMEVTEKSDKDDEHIQGSEPPLSKDANQCDADIQNESTNLEEKHTDRIVGRDQAQEYLLAKDVDPAKLNARVSESALYYVPLTSTPTRPLNAPIEDVIVPAKNELHVEATEGPGRPSDSKSVSAESPPPSTHKGKDSATLKLSEARKARHLFEKMVERSPPPLASAGRRRSLSGTPPVICSLPKSKITTLLNASPRSSEYPVASPTTTSTIDLSGSKDRLLRRSLPSEPTVKSTEQVSSPVPLARTVSFRAVLPPTPPTPPPPAPASATASTSTTTKEPRRSILEMAREKRVSRESTLSAAVTTTPPPTVPNTFSTCTADSATKEPQSSPIIPKVPFSSSSPSQTRSNTTSTESPVLQLARQKRESKREAHVPTHNE